MSNQLTDQMALEIIKQVLDIATNKGVFTKIDESMTAINAFQHISSKLLPAIKKDEHSI